jgi:hypothetical protein
MFLRLAVTLTWSFETDRFRDDGRHEGESIRLPSRPSWRPADRLPNRDGCSGGTRSKSLPHLTLAAPVAPMIDPRMGEGVRRRVLAMLQG